MEKSQIVELERLGSIFFEFFLLSSARRRIIAITLLPGGQWNATCSEHIDFVLAGFQAGGG
jgi:hypothetical protein